MNNSFGAIRDYRNKNHCMDFGIPFFTEVEAVNEDENILYDRITECVISEDVGYAQLRITISWSLNDKEFRGLGLHASYNTNFQDFSYDGQSLIIDADDRKIYIHDKK